MPGLSDLFTRGKKLLNGRITELPSDSSQFLATASSEKAIVADLDKPFGQDMAQKAANEFKR
jgi:hypothetical protein